MYFFFKAEDGIRGLVRSRGLGDGYKRQIIDSTMMSIEQVMAQISDLAREKLNS